MNCIVSVAFREPYVTHSRNQRLQISADVPVLAWEDEVIYREGGIKENIVERFQKSLYGFKPHAIQYAINKGYTKIIWLDPSVLPTTPVQILFDALDEHPMIVRTGEHKLSEMCNKKALDWFETDQYEIRNEKHIGGTVYCFNFNDPKTVNVFESWKRAEENGIFGTQDEFMAGHWADESCLALAMWEYGMPQYWEYGFKYLNQKEF